MSEDTENILDMLDSLEEAIAQTPSITARTFDDAWDDPPPLPPAPHAVAAEPGRLRVAREPQRDAPPRTHGYKPTRGATASVLAQFPWEPTR